MRNFFSLTGAVVLAATFGANASQAQTPAATPMTADQLEEAVDLRWKNDATLKACVGCDLDVEATGDVVRVSGEVPTAALRARAARLANVRGVARVTNEIEVVTPRSAADATRAGANKAANKTAEGVSKAADKTAEGLGKAADKTAEGLGTAANKTGGALAKTGEVMDDTWVTTKVKSKIVADDVAKSGDVTVDTKQNVVTLTGTVPSAAVHEAVLRIARETKGVHRVVDLLKIAPKTN